MIYLTFIFVDKMHLKTQKKVYTTWINLLIFLCINKSFKKYEVLSNFPLQLLYFFSWNCILYSLKFFWLPCNLKVCFFETSTVHLKFGTVILIFFFNFFFVSSVPSTKLSEISRIKILVTLILHFKVHCFLFISLVFGFS